MRQELREIRTQGTPMRPLKIYKMQDKSGKIDVPYHWQEHVEILWVLEGSLSVTVREKQYAGTVGDIFYINPRELHSMQSTARGCTYLALVFPLTWLQFDQADEAGEKYLRPLAELNAYVTTRLPHRTAKKAESLFQEIYTLYEGNDDGAWLGIKAGLLRFYFYLYKDGVISRREKNSQQMDMLLHISQYVQEHCGESLSLDALGKRFHMSPKYFSVYFQKHFSRNFTDYLAATRIERAKKLLLETEADMELVAQQTGFSGSSYFIRVFRKTTGMTPGQYRKDFRQKPVR
ncbi:MAG TPA: hypothetical protein DF613_08195 [Lachnospiraceae bacterium]|nr:hypothetical protein [Lachnospiraceae bacterium]